MSLGQDGVQARMQQSEEQESIPLQDRRESLGLEHASMFTDSAAPTPRTVPYFSRADIGNPKAPTLMSHNELQAKEQSQGESLRRHWLVLYLYSFYTIVAVFSWTALCILSSHPIGNASWQDSGGHYSPSDLATTGRIRRAATVGVTGISALGIPITSGIAARAAAPYCQWNAGTARPKRTLRQMLVLADKGWSGYDHIRDLVTPRRSKLMRTPLLVFSMVLVSTAFLIPILQSVFMGSRRVTVLLNTHSDAEEAASTNSSRVLGPLISPNRIIGVESRNVARSFVADLATSQPFDKNPFLWSQGTIMNVTSLAEVLSINSNTFGSLGKEVFATNFPVGTQTGVLRNLATRLNTSMSCDLIDWRDIPTFCPVRNSSGNGGHPPTGILSSIRNETKPAPFSNETDPNLTLRLCVPGFKDISPWNSTLRPQNILEHMWMDLEYTNLPGRNTYSPTAGSNFTLHCTSNTTLGYFELPNYWNGGVAGPLLSYLDILQANATFHNVQDVLDATQAPLLRNNEYASVPGPLLASMAAIFDGDNWFSLVRQQKLLNKPLTDSLTLQLCNSIRLPFDGLSQNDIRSWHNPAACDNDGNLVSPSNFDPDKRPLFFPLLDWLSNWSDPQNALVALMTSAYAVHNRMFLAAAQVEGEGMSFNINTAPGTSVQKPEISAAPMVLISCLLAFQILGLGLLTWYALRDPVWTETLDARAVLRIGAEVAKGGSHELHDLGLGSSKEDMAPLLDRMEGYIGAEYTIGTSESGHDADSMNGRMQQRLILGGEPLERCVPTKEQQQEDLETECTPVHDQRPD